MRPGIRKPRKSALSILSLVLSVVLAGCLPSSCRRTEERALFPADSLSRRIAQQVPVDTLEIQWQAAGEVLTSLEHPRTVRFGPEGRIFVSDTESHRVYGFDSSGVMFAEIAAPEFQYPYLAGVRGDTLLVFNPEDGRIDYVVNGATVDHVETPSDLPGNSPLQYVAASEDAFFFKVVPEDAEGYLARLNDLGDIEDRYILSGPNWRHAGFLRMWGDTLLSLSGYRPVVYTLPPGGPLDSLTLRGFDSPMLARSRSFILGDTDEAPLLTASAAPADSLLFVINLRPGWLRIDAYDVGGRLRHVMVQPSPEFNRAYYPADLDVREVAGGGYEIAVISSTPQPMIRVYRWDPRALE